MLLQCVVLSEDLPATMDTAHELLSTLMCSKMSSESGSCDEALTTPFMLAHVVPDIRMR